MTPRPRPDSQLLLVSHPLCPYVQRAVIVLEEKGAPYARRDIDLAAKPDWFLRLSPLGKTPVLRVGDHAVFESAVIVEYLEETRAPALHPADPLRRALHRAHVELASQALALIAGLYNAPDEAGFRDRQGALAAQFDWLEEHLAAPQAPGPWFDGADFSLVDAAFAPVFRYFDVIDGFADLGLFAPRPRLAAWRAALADRASVRRAVAPDYGDRLTGFLARRPGHLAGLVRRRLDDASASAAG